MRLGRYKLIGKPELVACTCMGCVLYVSYLDGSKGCFLSRREIDNAVVNAVTGRRCGPDNLIYQWATAKGHDAHIARLALLRLKGEI